MSRNAVLHLSGEGPASIPHLLIQTEWPNVFPNDPGEIVVDPAWERKHISPNSGQQQFVISIKSGQDHLLSLADYLRGSRACDSPSSSGLVSGAGKMLCVPSWRRSRPRNAGRNTTFIIVCWMNRPRGLPGKKYLAKLRPLFCSSRTWADICCS